MLPYFEYTEDVQSFCHLMGYTVDVDILLNTNVCMYSLKYSSKPCIAPYNLSYINNPLIPSQKVLQYLTLMLNGYSYSKAIEEISVVG